MSGIQSDAAIIAGLGGCTTLGLRVDIFHRMGIPFPLGGRGMDMVYLGRMCSNYPRRPSCSIVIEQTHGESTIFASGRNRRGEDGVITYLVRFCRDWIGVSLDDGAYNAGILACHCVTFFSRRGLPNLIY